MKTIEELTSEIMKSIPKHIVKNNMGIPSYQVWEEDVEKGVIQALKEQRKDDIKVFSEWLCNNLGCFCTEDNNFVSKFKQYMIKGE